MKHHTDRRPFAKKSFGQNFLIDDNIVRKIVDAVYPTKDDLVLEIGPGRGALTEYLVERAGSVAALELDRDLYPVLTEAFGDSPKFTLIEGDALDFDFAELAASHGDKIKLAANLPYNISTAILQRLMEQRAAFSSMVLMFQKEVVDRITARPGDGERGFLTVLVEAYLTSEKLFDVPPRAFRPAPKVTSSVVMLKPRPEGEIGIENMKLFRQLVSAGFAQKRKTMLNNFRGVKHLVADAAATLESASIDPSRRAETLTLDEWKALYRGLK